jgi:hypothetical protein
MMAHNRLEDEDYMPRPDIWRAPRCAAASWQMEVGAAILSRVLRKMEEGAYGVDCALNVNFHMLMYFVSSQAKNKSLLWCERECG